MSGHWRHVRNVPCMSAVQLQSLASFLVGRCSRCFLVTRQPILEGLLGETNAAELLSFRLESSKFGASRVVALHSCARVALCATAAAISWPGSRRTGYLRPALRL